MNAPPAPTRNRILIIDDNASIHADFRKILGQEQDPNVGLARTKALLFGESAAVSPHAGFVIESAFQGREGLEMVKQAAAAGDPYALAFVDVRMPPGWDGVETIGHIWKCCPEIQIVVCTAYSDYSWEEMIHKLGHSPNLVVLKKAVRQHRGAATRPCAHGKVAFEPQGAIPVGKPRYSGAPPDFGIGNR